MIEGVLWFLVCASGAYWLVVWASVWRFFHRPLGPSSYTPPVSILKPVKGLDADAYENFVAFCRQEYPEFELLFGVSAADDPAVRLIRRLQQEFPQRVIRLIVAGETGMNPKSSILHELTQQARHEVLVISDSDIRVTPDYLRRVVAPLEDPSVGLVTCPYRSLHARSLAARLEGLYLNASFVPSAIAGGTLLARRFGLGATIAVRRDDLLRAGGYGRIVDHLADDYHVARRIAGLGLKIVISTYVVDNVLGHVTFGQQWDREVRWARTIRALQPWGYPGLLLTFTTPLAAALVAASGLGMAAASALAAAMIVRWLFAAHVTRLRGSDAWSSLAWLPLRDVLTVLVWARAAVGRHVVWRGRVFRLSSGDRVQFAPARTSLARRLFCGAVRCLDAVLRRTQGVYEYSDHEDCFFRVGIARAGRAVVLRDGTRVDQGHTVAELHYWNERMPPLPKAGADLAWARVFQKRLLGSLRELARHLEADGHRDVRAVRAALPLQSGNPERMMRQFQRLGGATMLTTEHRGLARRLHAIGEHLLLWALITTFNPRSLPGWRDSRRRYEVWLSRDALVARFGAPRPSCGSDHYAHAGH